MTLRPRNQQGFTLVEVIAGVVIFGIVLGIVYSLLLLTNRYSRAVITNSDLQNSVRLTKQAIEDEVRTANKVQISSNTKSTDFHHVIYVNDDGDVVVRSKNKERILGSRLSEDINIDLQFQKVPLDENQSLLGIRVAGSTLDGLEYSLESAIAILNAAGHNAIMDDTSSGGLGTYLYFSKPEL